MKLDYKIAVAHKGKIVIAGATGLIGVALSDALVHQGDSVVKLSRSEPKTWDPEHRHIDDTVLLNADAVINLAGEPIAGQQLHELRWTRARKERIMRSRVQTTSLLADCIVRLKNEGRLLPTFKWINASAVGYYGDTAQREVDETTGPGTGFLPEVAEAWEGATDPVARSGLPVIIMRLGIVLSPRGGALHKMLPIFRLGLGGPLGSAKQWMSWVSIEDVVDIVKWLLVHDVHGPFNIVAPEPVTNVELTRCLAKALHRPAPFKVPGWLIKTLLGEMGEATLLSSQKVKPTRLLEAGYAFKHPTLGIALKALL